MLNRRVFSDGSTETFYIMMTGTLDQPTKNRTEDGTKTVLMLLPVKCSMRTVDIPERGRSARQLVSRYVVPHLPTCPVLRPVCPIFRPNPGQKMGHGLKTGQVRRWGRWLEDGARSKDGASNSEYLFEKSFSET